MADPKRHTIVEAVVARMKLINGAGSYTTDVDDKVEDSRTNWQQEELPAISVFDGDAVGTPTTTGRNLGTVHTMPVLIRGIVEQGTTAANARTLIKDIMTAIRQDDKFHVGGVQTVMQTRQVRDGILRNADSFEVEGCEVEIEVQFLTQKFNAET
jgi:hypothetical protein